MILFSGIEDRPVFSQLGETYSSKTSAEVAKDYTITTFDEALEVV